MMNIFNNNGDGKVIGTITGNVTIDMNSKNKKEIENMKYVDIDVLADKVLDRILGSARAVSTESKDDGGKWAKTSALHGKVICGELYNPYTIRRHLPRKFKAFMNKYELNVDKAIKCEYSYRKAIKYVVDEVKTLAKLEKRDVIALDERKHFWRESDIVEILIDYFNNVQNYVKRCVDNHNNKRNRNSVCVLGEWINYDEKKIIVTRYGDDEIVTKRTVKSCKILTEAADCINKLNSLCFGGYISHTYKSIADIMAGVKILDLPSAMETRTTYRGWRDVGFKIVKNPDGYKHHKLFIENFKKAGAYYTIKNDIMFNDLMFDDRKGRVAREYLRSLINEPAYILYAKYKKAKGYEVIDR